MSVPLVAVAHGSRDPRSPAVVRALVDSVAAKLPGVEVRTSFLDLSEPSIADVLVRLHEEGHREAVVVPLLLGSAYHARVDLPGLVDEVTANHPLLTVSTSDVLGVDPVLESVALHRLAETGAELTDPRLGLVLAAVGSSNDAANAVVARMARRWQDRFGVPVAPAFASATQPDVPAAIARLRARRHPVRGGLVVPRPGPAARSRRRARRSGGRAGGSARPRTACRGRRGSALRRGFARAARRFLTPTAYRLRGSGPVFPSCATESSWERVLLDGLSYPPVTI